ncbi:MAG: diguanylate cyclase [Burkholderiales bacterium]|nr:diguanylate cyclase [Burkholderiales bacterium]
MPVVMLSHATAEQHLNGLMSVAVVPVGSPNDPDVFWDAPETRPRTGGAQDHWQADAGERVVGRVVLQSLRERDMYVIQVPTPRVDHVQVWFRERGRPWQGAEAGDLVPLSRWPFFGQFPAFPLPMGETPVDVIVTVANDGPIDVPVLIKPDRIFREHRLLQANLLGVVLGLGLMGAMVCLLTATVFRNRAAWVLFAYAAGAFLMVANMSGYTAIWATPDSPGFNDGAKHFSGMVMAGLIVAVTVEMLEELDFWAPVKWLGAAAVALSIAYGALQAWVLPAELRPVGGLAWAGLCAALSVTLCVVSWLRGGRYVGLVGTGVGAAVLVIVLVGAVGLGIGGMHFDHTYDVRTLGTALLLFASAQLLRHTLFRRERYGRDVLGRAAIAANRDPLTALLSYGGMQHAYEEATLRQAAGRGPIAVMMFALPGFDRCSVDHGFILTERAVVRFAAGLQQVLGQDWCLGRLSKTRFGALANNRDGAAGLLQCATRALAHCSRIHDPLSPVTDFDLRIVCTYRQDRPLLFKDLLRELEEAGQQLESSKRIALV